MKHVVTLLLFASIAACSMIALAEKYHMNSYEEYGETMGLLLLPEKIEVGGVIVQTARGIGITGDKGTYLLKGAELEEMVGKKVKVTGVIRGDFILALKIVSQAVST